MSKNQTIDTKTCINNCGTVVKTDTSLQLSNRFLPGENARC